MLKLMRWRSELIVQGTNSLMRKLLCRESDPPRPSPRPLVQEGPPRASQPSAAPSRSPSLIEVAYSSAFEAKPDLYVPGIGMPIPARLETWLAEEPRESA